MASERRAADTSTRTRHQPNRDRHVNSAMAPGFTRTALSLSPCLARLTCADGAGRAGSMQFLRVLFALLAIAFSSVAAQSDPCLAEDYAEANCARVKPRDFWAARAARDVRACMREAVRTLPSGRDSPRRAFGLSCAQMACAARRVVTSSLATGELNSGFASNLEWRHRYALTVASITRAFAVRSARMSGPRSSRRRSCRGLDGRRSQSVSRATLETRL